MRIAISAFKVIKRYLFRKQLGKVGVNFFCGDDSRILLAKSFSCGDNVFIGPGAYLVCILDIESNVMLGPKVTVLGGSHSFGVKGELTRFLKPDPQASRKVTLCNDSWIGANVTIIGPLEVGHGAVVGASSVVTKDVPPFTVNVGSPSKPIKKIFSDDILRQHLILLGFSETYATSIVAKRNDKLDGTSISILDNTEEYRNVFSD